MLVAKVSRLVSRSQTRTSLITSVRPIICMGRMTPELVFISCPRIVQGGPGGRHAPVSLHTPVVVGGGPGVTVAYLTLLDRCHPVGCMPPGDCMPIVPA